MPQKWLQYVARSWQLTSREESIVVDS